MASETIYFNGIAFRRYPDSKRRCDRDYYKPSGADKQRGIGNLHQEVWKATHGAIPAGHIIHHRDGNPLNNAVDNLECIPESSHPSRHRDTWRGRAFSGEDYAKAAAWHKSEDGRAWHRRHGKACWVDRGTEQRACDCCGKQYEKVSGIRGRFCSNACKSEFRRRSGVDNEERVCPQCGGVFFAGKYTVKRYCSRACSAAARKGWAR